MRTVEVIAAVAKRLANTPAVCRKAYVHPEIVTQFANATLPEPTILQAHRGLSANERRLLAFLRGVGKQH